MLDIYIYSTYIYRSVYKSRGGAQTIIIEFFDSINEKIKVRHFIQNIWTKYDITSTGYLTPSEVKVFIQEFSQKEITEEECEYFINSIDENQDSKIDREELIEFILTGLNMNEKQKSIYASRGKTQVTVIEFFEATRKYVMNPDRYREDMSKLVVNNGQEEIKLNASHVLVSLLLCYFYQSYRLHLLLQFHLLLHQLAYLFHQLDHLL